MRKLLLLGAIFLGLTGSAQARLVAGGTLLGAGAQFAKAADVAQPPCPTGVPVQTVTVLNQAHASRFALSKVERAVVDQSLQLRAAWGTPCVQFGSAGWPLYLRIGSTQWGAHYGNPTIYAEVYTDGLPYRTWSQIFSHEIIEMLVDPDGLGSPGQPSGVDYSLGGTAYSLEVADPVDERAYILDDVYVSDFVLPAYYAGAMLDSVATGANVTCISGRCEFTGPLIAPLGAAGPYDAMGLLTHPWQTTWARSLDRSS